ncbi:MAG: glycerate kinase [Candidatus Eremiobacteraeota bacterium]|nr:glycerate kinase [Candidatus Eremiobacteraeota bacterium]MBV8365853.1 glycerate kinase [Candidatus Eremiobacteraeota bacterium]
MVIAPDKFKGSLRGIEVARAIEAGFRHAFPDAAYDLVPVADGGDGTLDALVSALHGREISATVTGPDGNPVDAAFGLIESQGLGVVEMARASGLALLRAGTNDPMTATSRGTGELIAAALKGGARRIIVAIGGSATNDAGAGALRALGARFVDANIEELPPGGAALIRLRHIDDGDLQARLAGATIEIACDVTNPLIGPNGASAIYGPQKGASPQEVVELDAALAQFAEIARKTTGVDVRSVPGAGAAGGFGGGFLALAGAQLRPGAELVLDVLDFAQHLSGAGLVVTGEGRLDKQTLSGKAPYAVARAAQARGIPAVAIAGSIALTEDELESAGISKAVATAPASMRIEEAMRRAYELTQEAARRLAETLRT